MPMLTERIPLTQTESGDIFIEGSRVPLETLVEAWEAGTLPEDFVRDYPHLSLADIYAILAYYLRHQAEVRDYMANQKRKAEEFRKGNPYAAASIQAKLKSE